MRTNARCSFRNRILSFLLPVALIATAWGQAALTFDIPAQDLAVALESFAAQADKEVLFDREQAIGKTSAPVKGVLDPAAALRALIAPSGLPVRQVNDRTFVVGSARTASESSTRLAQADAATATQVTEDSGDARLEEVLVFGGLENELSIGSKSGLSLRETPKSVTVVTRERIDAQNLTSLLDVVMQTTGIAVASYGPVDNYYVSRGFELQAMQVDGGATAFMHSLAVFLTPDTAGFERVEVLRGVDGMYTSAASPGGIINLVRKRAKATPEFQASLSAGSWNTYRGELDLTGPLAQDGRLRGRLVGSHESGDYFYDRGTTDRNFFFGTLEYDLTPSTLLVAGASYERRDEGGYVVGGLPRLSDGRDLHFSRDTAFNPDWNHWNFETKEFFARAEQKLGESAVLKFNFTRLDQFSQIGAIYPYGSIDPVTRTGSVGYGFDNDYLGVQDLADLSLNGKVSLFGREHRYTLGLDYGKVDSSGSRNRELLSAGGAPWVDGSPLDVFDFDAALYASPVVGRVTATYPAYEQVQRGYYGTLGIQLTEPLRLTIGGRYGTYRYFRIYQGMAPDGSLYTPSVNRDVDQKFVPSAALSYDFARDWSAYASYGETFEVQSTSLQAPLPGAPLDPITGASYEVGVKGEIGAHLNTALSVYRVERKGQAVSDPRYPYVPGEQGSSCCYLPSGLIRTDGLDAELSGRLMPGWQMFAGYTYSDREVGGGDFWASYYLNLTPSHMFKLWTTWQLPGEHSRWTLSTGVTAQTETYISGFAREPNGTDFIPFRFTQGGYALWNASVQYRLGDAWTIGLYGENLTDKTYYGAIGDTGGSNHYGLPRNYVLSVRAKW